MARHFIFVLLSLSVSTPKSLHIAKPDLNPKAERLVNWSTSNSKFIQELQNFHDLQYYGEIEMGGQRLQAIMDTGSIEIVIISEKCKYWCGIQHPLYRPNASIGYKEGTLDVLLSYGSGDLLGNEAYDTLQIGPFMSHDQPFWEVTDADMALLFDASFEAIVGLGPISNGITAMTPGGTKNAASYASTLQNLHVTRYSICMSSKPHAPGYILWEDDMVELHPEYFQEIKLVESGFWLTHLTDVMLGNVKISCSGGCGAIIDSGTSLMALPDVAYRRLSRSIDGMGSNCLDLYNLPNLTFKLGGLNYSLPPDSYLGNMDGQVPKSMSGHFSIKANTTCQHALMHVDMKSSLGAIWILGMPFFRSYYTAFVQGSPAKVYTTEATTNCGLVGANSTGFHTNDSLQMLFPERRHTARRINVTHLRLPTWARKAHALGYLPELMPTSGRKLSRMKARRFHSRAA